jgi:hypothetical protein
MQALWIGLEDVLEVRNLKTERDSRKPKMSLEWDPEIPGVQIIAGTIAKSLAAVAASYPGHVKYIETEE